MRSLIFAVLFILLPVLCSAQTPEMGGPLGNMGPNPNPPLKHKLYEPPPMQFIPDGEYEMGDHLKTGWIDEHPVHGVYIDGFYMDTFEVTNKEYCTYLNSAYRQGLVEVAWDGQVSKKGHYIRYCETTASSPSSRITWNGSAFGVTAGKEDHPMLLVSWYGAVAYANWRSVQVGLTPCYDLSTWECNFGAGGYRLPTEAEWEKAARGAEHNPYYEYPWGDSIDGSMANYGGSGDPYESGDSPATTPVGYYDGNQIPPGNDMANGYGLYDMAGNVSEWCNDWWDLYYYQYCVDHGIYDNPIGPSLTVGSRICRGGSWYYNVPNLRCSKRSHINPGFMYDTIGFRVVLN